MNYQKVLKQIVLPYRLKGSHILENEKDALDNVFKEFNQTEIFYHLHSFDANLVANIH